jgi:hypothetical protein
MVAHTPTGSPFPTGAVDPTGRSELQALARVQLRSISRQALRLEALGRAISQEFLGHLTAMNRCTIPDEHHPPRYFTQQMLQKGHDIYGIDRSTLTMEYNLPPARWN